MPYPQSVFTSSSLRSLDDPKLYDYVEAALLQGYGRFGIPHEVASEIAKCLRASNGKKSAQALRQQIEPLSDKLSIFWQKRTAYKQNGTRHQEVYSHIRKWVAGNTIAEVGCADGGLGRLLVKRKSIRYVGTDIHVPKYAALPSNMRLLSQTTPTELPIENDSVDTVLMVDMLHHVPEMEQATLIREVRDKLSADGRVVLFEYTYSNVQKPLKVDELFIKFSDLSEYQKHEAMAIIDWIGNVLIGSRSTPMPYSYRDLESWGQFFESLGFKLLHSEYLGFSTEIFHPGSYGIVIAEKQN